MDDAYKLRGYGSDNENHSSLESPDHPHDESPPSHESAAANDLLVECTHVRSKQYITLEARRVHRSPVQALI